MIRGPEPGSGATLATGSASSLSPTPTVRGRGLLGGAPSNVARRRLEAAASASSPAPEQAAGASDRARSKQEASLSSRFFVMVVAQTRGSPAKVPGPMDGFRFSRTCACGSARPTRRGSSNNSGLPRLVRGRAGRVSGPLPRRLPRDGSRRGSRPSRSRPRPLPRAGRFDDQLRVQARITDLAVGALSLRLRDRAASDPPGEVAEGWTSHAGSTPTTLRPARMPAGSRRRSGRPKRRLVSLPPRYHRPSPSVRCRLRALARVAARPAGPALLRRAPPRARDRPDTDDLRLRAVVRVPGLVVEHLVARKRCA